MAEVRLSQASNAKSPIDVTELGITIDFKPVHSRNAYDLIRSIELGRVMDDRPG